jgi:hypothetical protein
MPFDEEMSSAVLKQILHFLFAFQWYGKEHLGRADFCVVDGDFRFADCTIFLVVDHTRVVVNVFVCHPAPALSALCVGSNPDTIRSHQDAFLAPFEDMKKRAKLLEKLNYHAVVLVQSGSTRASLHPPLAIIEADQTYKRF